MTRSEQALQLRVSLIEALCIDGVYCASRGEVHEAEDLDVDHVDGITWYARGLNFLDRIRRYWREFDRGVRLRAICRRCNVITGQRFRGRARYA